MSTITLKSAAEIDRMAEAGRVVASALAAVRHAAAVGTALIHLDDVAESVIRSRGALPLFKHYHPRWSPTPFPGTICASINDVVVHGIPGDQTLADGSTDYVIDDDGWTVRSASGARAAHAEHTVAITATGPFVLTAL